MGGKPIHQKVQIRHSIIFKVKQSARDLLRMAIKDFEAELVQGFPQKIIPSKSTIHRILAQSGTSCAMARNTR